MMPIIFTIPFINKDIPGYGLMMMLGFLSGIWWAVRRAQKSGANPDVVLNCGFIALIAGVVGCRIMYVMANWQEFAGRGLWAMVDVSKGGLEFYGGFILSTVCVIFSLWRAKLSLRWYFDILAPSLALGLAFGRVGCFLNGCCYGGVCDAPWAVKFPAGSPAQMVQWQDYRAGATLPQQLIVVNSSGIALPIPREDLAVADQSIADAARKEADLRAELGKLDGEIKNAEGDSGAIARLRTRRGNIDRKLTVAVRRFGLIRYQMKKYDMSAEQIRTLALQVRSLPVHPTQLYSTIAALLIALVLNGWYWRRGRDGQVICLLFVIQPITRWTLEIIRDDVPAITLGLFTRSQVLAIGLTIVGLVGLMILQRLPARSPAAELWEPPEDEAGEKKPVVESA